MPKETISAVVQSGRILVSDGAWGTFLYEKGLQAGECPERFNLDRPEDVRDIAWRYSEAGADLVETNSFGASSFKLALFGLDGETAAINEAAARASREAVGEDKWVVGSIGPTGKMLLMGDVTESELYEAFKTQAVALEKGGADAVCIETMSDIDEAVEAIKAVKENTQLEIICSFTFERTVKGEYRTMMGVSPTQAAEAAAAAGADIIGTNCGNGIERMIEIVQEMQTVNTGLPIMVNANAGLPQLIEGKTVFPDSPADMAKQVKKLIEAGASIIGGCCGTTPEHIKAIAEEVREVNT
jgi:5-methyltetrahydrofolate--homocysteine methyltransferase